MTTIKHTNKKAFIYSTFKFKVYWQNIGNHLPLVISLTDVDLV